MSIAAGIAAALAVGSAGFVLGRRTAQAPPPPPPPASVTPVVSPPASPPADPERLGRAELIAAAQRAADAFAAGRPVAESSRSLEGRDFELALPFACPGAQPAGEALSAAYDEKAGVLRARAQPVRWPADDWLSQAPGGREDGRAIEGVEGFWIPRPWTSSEACPAPQNPSPGASAEAPPPAEPSLAIAHFFTAGASRLGRRDGKAYQTTKRVEPEALDLSQGLQLRLSGTLAAAPGGGTVVCRAAGAGRPVCILSARFDAVTIANPATGATIARWDVSSSDPIDRR